MGEATLVKKDKRSDADLQDHWRLPEVKYGIKMDLFSQTKEFKRIFRFFFKCCTILKNILGQKFSNFQD